MFLFQSRPELRQGGVECDEQILIPAIPQTHPDKLALCVRRGRQIYEVLVFADHHHLIGRRIIPDGKIGDLIHFEIQNMLGGKP